MHPAGARVPWACGLMRCTPSSMRPQSGQVGTRERDSMKVVLCLCCHRHVKAHDVRCPFCDAAMPVRVRSRVAAAVAVVVGLVVGACSSASSPSEGQDAGDGDDAACEPTNGPVGIDPLPDAGYGLPPMRMRMAAPRPPARRSVRTAGRSRTVAAESSAAAAAPPPRAAAAPVRLASAARWSPRATGPVAPTATARAGVRPPREAMRPAATW